MTFEGFPTNAAPTRGFLLASAADAAIMLAVRVFEAVGSALTMTPETRSVLWATRGVCIPWRLRPRPSPERGQVRGGQKVLFETLRHSSL